MPAGVDSAWHNQCGSPYYMEFSGKMKVDDYMLGVYCGIGVGLICSGIVFLIRNKRLMKDEEKLKEARLQVTDERNIEIGSLKNHSLLP